MTISLGESGELTELAQAIGVLDDAGNLDLSWFSTPLTRLAGVVTVPSQRAALMRFFDLALPPAPEPGRPAGEKWHPLLGALDRGNLYLTLLDAPAAMVLGIAGDFHTADGADVPATLRLQADVVVAGSSVDLVIGTAAHPITVEVRVQTGWTYDPPGGHPVGLAAITGRFTIVPDPDQPSFGLELVLEQLSLRGETPADTVMDVDDLGREAPDLLAALLTIVLSEVGGDATVTLLADHLLALFGLADAEDIPTFPFADLGDGPVALQHWMAQLLGAGAPAITVPATA